MRSSPAPRAIAAAQPHRSLPVTTDTINPTSDAGTRMRVSPQTFNTSMA